MARNRFGADTWLGGAPARNPYLRGEAAVRNDVAVRVQIGGLITGRAPLGVAMIAGDQAPRRAGFLQTIVARLLGRRA